MNARGGCQFRSCCNFSVYFEAVFPESRPLCQNLKKCNIYTFLIPFVICVSLNSFKCIWRFVDFFIKNTSEKNIASEFVAISPCTLKELFRNIPRCVTICKNPYVRTFYPICNTCFIKFIFILLLFCGLPYQKHALSLKNKHSLKESSLQSFNFSTMFFFLISTKFKRIEYVILFCCINGIKVTWVMKKIIMINFDL